MATVEHDRLCRGVDGVSDCRCDLIAQVRANERAKQVNAIIAEQVRLGDDRFCQNCAYIAVAVIDNITERLYRKSGD